MSERVFVSSAPRNTLYDRLVKEPASGVVHEWRSISGVTRPWPFGTVLRRNRKNLALVANPEATAKERLLVLVDDGRDSFTGIRVDPMAPFTQAVANNWDAAVWEPDRA